MTSEQPIGSKHNISEGYIEVKTDTGRKYEHRHKIEEKLGRELKDNEIVHHKNEDTKDNSIENLEIMKASEHVKKHHEGKGVGTIELECDYCGEVFMREYSQRAENKGHDNTYCSRECVGKANCERLVNHDPENFNEKVNNKIIRKELDEGETGYSIAKKHGWPNGTVYNRIRKMDI